MYNISEVFQQEWHKDAVWILYCIDPDLVIDWACYCAGISLKYFPSKNDKNKARDLLRYCIKFMRGIGDHATLQQLKILVSGINDKRFTNPILKITRIIYPNAIASSNSGQPLIAAIVADEVAIIMANCSLNQKYSDDFCNKCRSQLQNKLLSMFDQNIKIEKKKI